jgi:hypothetical protein
MARGGRDATVHEDHLSGNLGSRYGFPLPAGKPERVNREGVNREGVNRGWPQLSLEPKKKEHFHKKNIFTE